MRSKPLLIIFLLSFLVVGTHVNIAAGADKTVALSAWQALHDAEAKHSIPRGLLHSISLVETGQGLGNQYMPWPYTTNVNSSRSIKAPAQKALLEMKHLQNLGFKSFSIKKSSGKFYKSLSPKTAQAVLVAIDADDEVVLRGLRFSKRFKNKWEATFFVNRLLAAGHNNIDIGLMQVNWMYHGSNFADIAQAFDPYHNVRYAVSYLMEHRQNHDWWTSVGRYHSKTSVHADRYVKNVWAMYKKVHRLNYDGSQG